MRKAPPLDPNDTSQVLASLDRDMHRTVNARSIYEAHLKRVRRPDDGRGKSPASLEALRLHRARTQLNASEGLDRKRCKFCRRVVVKGLEVCWFHGGAKTAQARRAAKKTGPVGTAARIAVRNVRRLWRAQAIPGPLMNNPLFQKVAKLVFPEQFGLKKNRDLSYNQRIDAGLLTREMIVAWLVLEEDPGAWARVVGKAYRAGFKP